MIWPCILRGTNGLQSAIFPLFILNIIWITGPKTPVFWCRFQLTSSVPQKVLMYQIRQVTEAHQLQMQCIINMHWLNRSIKRKRDSDTNNNIRITFCIVKWSRAFVLVCLGDLEENKLSWYKEGCRLEYVSPSSLSLLSVSPSLPACIPATIKRQGEQGGAIRQCWWGGGGGRRQWANRGWGRPQWGEGWEGAVDACERPRQAGSLIWLPPL